MTDTSFTQALLQPGKGAIPYTDVAYPDHPLTLNTYRASDYRPDQPIVIVQHGILRNGDEYRDFWVDAAEQHQLLIVAPTFSDAHWPGVEAYNDGRVFEHGTIRPVDTWTYSILPRLIRRLQAEGITTREKVYLFGHSAGGQFGHRLMSSQPHDLFEAVACGNSGWYTLPTLDAPFPEGLAGVGLDQGHLTRLLAYPLKVMAGDRDNNATDFHLPRTPAALRQGPERFARAHNYFEVGKQAAEKLGVPFNWTLQVVPGVGHDGRTMSAVAASLWFEGKMLATEKIAALVSQHVA